ncbi:hypothetical protein KW785_03675 [Candidatus Parcubacteria bacterium]|nr:hypothetical protein [Candidatus Parcubacteria bacterium]
MPKELKWRGFSPSLRTPKPFEPIGQNAAKPVDRDVRSAPIMGPLPKPTGKEAEDREALKGPEFGTSGI